MDTITPPSLSNPTPTSKRRVVFSIVAFVLLAAVLGATLWYAMKNKQQTGPAFNPTRQFVPQGTASLEVDQAIAAFNFPKPLPFFDERNVVQSLSMRVRVSASTTTSSVSFLPKAPRVADTPSRTPPPQDTPSTFLSYRIFGQDKETIRSAFVEYSKNMGWKIANTGEGKPLLFSSGTHQIVSVTLLDTPPVQGIDQPTIVVALIVQ